EVLPAKGRGRLAQACQVAVKGANPQPDQQCNEDVVGGNDGQLRQATRAAALKRADGEDLCAVAEALVEQGIGRAVGKHQQRTAIEIGSQLRIAGKVGQLQQ